MDEFDEFSLVKKLDQQKLTHLLISIPGSKELIVETNLLRPLDRICSMSTLRNHGCLRVQQLCMDKTIVWDDEAEQRIFFIRPTIGIARKICELIRSSPEGHYSIIQVGTSKNFFIRELEENGLYGQVDLYEFGLTLVHLESDLYSMELPQYPQTMFNRYFDAVARTLWQLQTLYGQIQTTFNLGESAQNIHKLFKRMCNDAAEPTASADQPISHLFLFDRRLDIASLLLTGLTYESILNDAFSYNCGKISFGEAVNQKLSQRQNNAATGAGPAARIYTLNNCDPIFSSIRNSHMTAVFPFLSAKTKFLQSSFDRVSSIKKVDEMKNFVSNELVSLREQQKQLEIHICACEYLLEKMRGFNERFGVEHAIIRGQFEDSEVFAFLQKLISAKCDPLSLLQLASLWSLRGNGIPAKYLRQFQEAFLHRYGFEQMAILYGLRTNGLIAEGSDGLMNNPLATALKSTKAFGRRQPNSPIDRQLRREEAGKRQMANALQSTLNGFPLCPDRKTRRESLASATTSTNEAADNCSSAGDNATGGGGLGFVFSDAYIPLISYLVDRTVTKGWDEQQLKRVLGGQAVSCSDPNARAPDNRIRRAILVCFVGGVTYAEIASLRCFAQNRDFRLIMITTHIIHREEHLKSYSQPP